MRTCRSLFLLALLPAVFAAGPAQLGAQVADSTVVPDWAAGPAQDAPPPLRVAERFGAEPLAVLAEASVGARDELEALRAWNQAGNLPVQNGFSRPLPLPRRVRFDASPLGARIGEYRGGVLGQSGPSTFVWGAEVRVESAHRLRFHLADVRLPASARLWIYGEDGEARGPFGLELVHDGGLVTPSVAGPVARIEVEVDEEAVRSLGDAGFTLDRVTELFALGPDGAPVTSMAPKGVDPSCLVDATCIEAGTFPAIEDARRAVGQMVFQVGASSFLCTGALLNDTVPGTFIPYFLTANHCFDTQASATSLEVIWDGKTTTCDGSIPDDFTRSNASTLLATSPQSDFTLVRLNDIPGGRTLLGWDGRASSVPVGTVLHRVSHPAPFGSPLVQSYSRSQISGIAQGCWNPQRFLVAAMQAGGTYGGSSGAPLMLASGHVVGQLSGGCGSDPETAEDGCDYSNLEGDGRFGHTFGFISDFLNPSGGGGDPQPPPGPWLSTPALPGFEAKVLIGGSRTGAKESQCIVESLCVSGAFAGRPEIFVKVIGPRPNGFLWAQISRFTPSAVEIWLRQTSTGQINFYELGAVPGSSDDVSGLQDREAFSP